MSTSENRSRSETLTANERAKALSSVAFNLGTALLAATIARAYVEGRADFTTALWSIAAIVAIYLGWKLLSLLRSEDEI